MARVGAHSSRHRRVYRPPARRRRPRGLAERTYEGSGATDGTTPGVPYPRTELDGGINDTVQTILVLDGSDFGTGVQCIQIDDELILAERRVGETFSDCERGYDDTTPAAHLDGTPVTYRRTREEIV